MFRRLESPLHLYVHVPFCSSKCWYCDFFSISNQNINVMERVIDRILADCRTALDELKPSSIATLFIGGGTPNILPKALLKKLLMGLDMLHSFNSIKEITIEANPGKVTIEQLKLLEDCGITRLSVGIQSLSAKQLERIGRVREYEDVHAKLDIIRAQWNNDLNFDLLFGLPEARTGDVLSSVRRIIEAAPQHISFYQLTVEEGTRLHTLVGNGSVIMPGADRILEEWQTAKKTLKEAGFTHYEVSNYALPGHECLHNIAYWEMNPYLGVGPSAVSTLPTPNGISRFTASKNVQKYVSGRFPESYTEEVLTSKEFFFENIMMGLRKTAGLELSELSRRFGVDLFSPHHPVFGPLVKKWQISGAATVSNQHLVLSQQGQNIQNELLREILVAMENLSLSRIIHWP